MEYKQSYPYIYRLKIGVFRTFTYLDKVMSNEKSDKVSGVVAVVLDAGFSDDVFYGPI